MLKNSKLQQTINFGNVQLLANRQQNQLQTYHRSGSNSGEKVCFKQVFCYLRARNYYLEVGTSFGFTRLRNVFNARNAYKFPPCFFKGKINNLKYFPNLVTKMLLRNAFNKKSHSIYAQLQLQLTITANRKGRVRYPMRWFLNLPNPFGRSRPWGLLSL
jgi:hypothetical protein